MCIRDSPLCAVAVRFVGSSDIAQDIAQDVIIKFWENQHNQQDIKAIDNFLYTMVKNESLNYLRGIRRENQRYDKLEIEEYEDPQVLNLLIAEDTNQALVSAINTLPEMCIRDRYTPGSILPGHPWSGRHTFP